MSESLSNPQHVIVNWLSRWRLGNLSTQIPLNEFEYAIDHISTCVECQTALWTLHTVAADPAIETLLLHTQNTTYIPDEIDLADYVALVTEHRKVAADKSLPAVATHLAACVYCRAIVQDTLESVDKAASVAFAASWQHDKVIETIWVNASENARQLVAPLLVWVRKQSLYITSMLDSIVIATVTSKGASPTLLGNDNNTPTQARCVINLCAEPTKKTSWLQLHISWRASITRRVSVEIRTNWRHDNDGEDVVPASAVAWSVNTSGAPANSDPLRSGVTRSDGLSAFFLDHPGEYILTISDREKEWLIPFEIRTITQSAIPTT